MLRTKRNEYLIKKPTHLYYFMRRVSKSGSHYNKKIIKHLIVANIFLRHMNMNDNVYIYFLIMATIRSSCVYIYFLATKNKI